MAKGIDEVIQDLTTSWEGYSGSRVEEFIKAKLTELFGNTEELAAAKCGYIPPMTKAVDGYYHIRGFADRNAYAEWNTAPEDNADLLLFDVAIPISDEQGAVSIVELTTGSNQKNIVSIDGSVVLKLRFTSQTYNPVTGKTTDTYEDGVLTVQRRANEGDTWRTVATLPIKSLPADSSEYSDVDISEMLNSGTSQVRVIVTGSQTQATSTYVVFQSVTKTRLALDFRNEWQNPITGFTSSMPLQYTYSGSVAKHLNLRISGENGTLVPTPIALGSGEYTETPAQFYINEDETVRILSHGVHEIEAWLSVDGTDIESEHIKSQVMVVQDESDMTPHIILNNVATSVVNWTSGKFFDFAVYNPSSDTMPVTFKVVNLTQDETYLTYTEQAAKNETRYTFSNMLEIESGVTAFSVRVLFESNGSAIRNNISIEVDNSMNFAPTGGADLIINPKLRNNSEANPATIINTVSGEVVAATFSGFGFVSDGWVTDENGIKCLRVPSGRAVAIDYEAFSGFMAANKTNSLTIELDLRTHNVTNDDAAVLKMCSYKSDGSPLGLEVRPMQAAFLTQSKVERSNQNVQFQEGIRTRVTINLLYNLSNSGRNYCRIFVNGIINCEFNYSTTDTFLQYVDGVQTSQGIRLGADGADIDVYGIKVYKKALTSTEVMQDYMASLDSGAEKIAFREKNDIMSNGVINYDLARTKYNVILWKGRYPTYGDQKGDSFKGDLEIHIVGDPEHSGTLTKMEVKGQGTSSMLYYWWNGSWKFTKGAGGTWTDENGTVKGAYYQLSDDVPKAKKLVGKVNFASSMQSHKIGATALFNDLKNEVCGKKSITATPGFENARSAVIEKPFLFFVQTETDAEPVFKSFMTFGPGKGDEPTFGYDADELPDTVCIEGADNDKPMIMGRAPWISEDVVYDDEDWILGADKNFSLVYGNPDKIAPIQNAFNFVYKTYYNIDYFDGTKADFLKAANLDTSKHYWLTQASGANAKYDLMRYDVITDTWVDAGLEKIAVGQYSVFNINEQCGNIASGTDYIAINEKFKAARLQYFRENVGNYFKLRELMFENNFCKFVGASDNRGKNIYFYNDERQGNLIDWEQDDLDTIFPTDNVGKSLKPYYVEEHDKDESGANYWNSEGNSLFNQLELAFPAELRSMMKEMLVGMKKLGGGSGVMDCFEKYFFSVQRYFPAVAYNEVARLLYEAARMAADAGKYTNGTDPMTQSHGDSLQCELQWVKLRVMYMSSYASYGEFGNIDSSSSAGSMNFRSITKVDGNTPTSYRFSIVPHNWLYPSFAKGQSLTYGKGNTLAPRLKAGELFTTDLGESDGNTNMFINGINYLRSLGDFTEISLGRELNITGERLTEFTVNGETEVQFRPTALTVVAPLIKKLILNNVSTLKGGLNLKGCTKLEELSLKGTKLTSVEFPATEYLTSAALPATLTSLVLDEQPNLSSLTMEGASEISTLKLGTGITDRRTILEMCFADSAPLDEVVIHDVDWEDFSLNYLNALCGKANADITGRIKVPDSAILTFEQKRAMLAKWGAVDDESNPLYLQYTKRVFTSVAIGGAPYIGETGQYQLTIKPNNVNGNNFTRIEWSMDAAGQAYASVDSESGVLTVNKIGVEDNNPRGVVTLTITLIDGSTVTATHTIGFYKRSCKLGDYVFADGTFSDIADENKTIVGICFYINPKNPAQRLCVAMKNTYPTSLPWGIFYTSAEGYENQNIADIVLADNPGYSVYDIQSLTNKGVRGFPGDGTIKDEYFRDESTMDNDGFVVPTDGSVAAEIGFVTLETDYGTFKKGEQVPWGLYNTLKIIAHRDIILNDTNVGLPLPEKTSGKSMLDDLTEKMNAVVAEMGATKYRQFYYPAASVCNAYEPEVKEGEVLAETFRQGHWALPSGGELFRLVWYHSKGYEVGVDNAIFARGKVEGKFTALSSWAWSSTEGSSTYCWYAYFASLATDASYKCNTGVVRAVAAF